MTPQQVTQSLAHLNMAINSFNGMTTGNVKENWPVEMQRLKEAGIPVENYVSSLDYSDANYAAVYRVLQGMTPMRDAIAQRAAFAAMGAPQPQAKPMYEPMSQFVGTVPGSQLPVYHDVHGGPDIIGSTPVGP